MGISLHSGTVVKTARTIREEVRETGIRYFRKTSILFVITLVNPKITIVMKK